MAGKEIGEEFEKLAEEIDHRAQSIKCSVREYIDGLHAIIDRLKSAQEAAQNDLGETSDEP